MEILWFIFAVLGGAWGLLILYRILETLNEIASDNSLRNISSDLSKLVRLYEQRDKDTNQ